MPTRFTPAFEIIRTITGVGDSDRSMFPETTACAAAAPESKGRTSTSTPCFLKKPSSLATYATSPENTGGTPGTAMETRSAASAGPAASANRTSGSERLLVVGVIPGPPIVRLSSCSMPGSPRQGRPPPIAAVATPTTGGGDGEAGIWDLGIWG